MMLYLILSCNSSDNIRNDLIATVGSKTLSANSFKFKYIDYLNKLGLDDQIHYRNQFLDNEINRLVILSLVDSLTENQILEGNEEIKINDPVEKQEDENKDRIKIICVNNTQIFFKKKE